MSTGPRRWLVPLVAALAVLAVVVGVVVWQQGAGSEDAGFADGGSDPGQGAPPYSGSPGSPGSEPGSEVPPDGGSDAPDVDEGMIPVASFYRYDDRHLALNYYNGIPECYGDAGVPQVEERADAVVVRIPRTPPTGSKDTACIDIAVAGSVDVTLTAPLGDRAVLDGAQEETEVKEAAAPHSERQGS